MSRQPLEPPTHVRSSAGVTVLDDESSHSRDREPCDARTVGRLDRDATTLSG
jgi:hypothetical protein